jgi:LDH2 family malate/lactate/ureidoglycolate dehydrogenase
MIVINENKMNKKNINIKHNILEKFICRIYEKHNVPKQYASIISKGLVRADVRGNMVSWCS